MAPEPAGTVPNPAFLQVSSCDVCGAGTGPSADRTTCVACDPGFSQDPDKDGGVCTPCPAGSYSAKGGAKACLPCDAGTFSTGGAAECTPCSAGTFASKPGNEACEPCLPGSFAPTEGYAQCSPCPIGTFASEGPVVACTECPKSFTTLAVGATTATACTCASESFWNRKTDECDACPRGAFCPGGLALPVVFAGNYGEFLGSLDGDAKRVAAKLAGTYTGGEGVHTLNVYECASSAVCPGETLEFTAMTEHYGVAALSKDLVRAGEQGPANAGASCPFDREGIACGRCKDEYFGKAECEQCDGGAKGGNIVLLLVFPVFMAILYRGTASHGTQRVQSAFILVSTAGMGDRKSVV